MTTIGTRIGLRGFTRRAFRVSATVEVFTWVGLIVSMIIKYPLEGSPLGVTIFGWAHGIVWIAFVLSCIAAAIVFRWPIWIAIVGVAISIVPFLTAPFRIWMERTGRLASEPSTPASDFLLTTRNR